MGTEHGPAPARHPVASPSAGTPSDVADAAPSAASTAPGLVPVRGAARPWEFCAQSRAHLARGGRSTSARPPLPRRRTGPLPGLRDAASPAAATYPGCTPACGTGETSQATTSPSSSRPWQLPRPHTKGPTVVPRSLRRGLQYDPPGAPATVEPLERALDRRLRSCLGVDKPCASSSKRKAPREVRCPARCPTPRQGRAINYMWRPVVLRHGPPATSPASQSAPGHAELQRSAHVPVNPLRFLCAPTL